jgi:hypothetical protein
MNKRMQCPCTFQEFLLRAALVISLLGIALFVAWNIDVSMRKRALSEEKVDTHLTDAHCWRWSDRHPVTAYNSCQKQFFGGGK